MAEIRPTPTSIARQALALARQLDAELCVAVTGHKTTNENRDERLLELTTELDALRPSTALGDLLSAALKIAPSEPVRDAFRHIARMEPTLLTDADRCTIVVAAMLDGLRDGNWPEMISPDRYAVRVIRP